MGVFGLSIGGIVFRRKVLEGSGGNQRQLRDVFAVVFLTERVADEGGQLALVGIDPVGTREG